MRTTEDKGGSCTLQAEELRASLFANRNEIACSNHAQQLQGQLEEGSSHQSHHKEYISVGMQNSVYRDALESPLHGLRSGILSSLVPQY